jgi:acyl-CoA thioester hydrolase
MTPAGEWLHLSGRLADGGHVLPVRIYYEDTDFSGLVYHASYLRFMERGRTDYLRLLGTEQGALLAEPPAAAPGFGFVVRSMKIDFLKPARMDDVVEVRTTPRQVSGASITLLQRVNRGAETLVEAEVRVAFIAGGRAQRIPKALREAMGAS